MDQITKISSACLWLLVSGLSFSQTDFAKHIDPFIGSEGPGNVFVGPATPFGMAKPGPDIHLRANSGYRSGMDLPLLGISQIHVSGTGGGAKYGNISVMPYSGDFESLSQTSSLSNEQASAGYFSAELGRWNIAAELTASDRVAFHQYTFTSNMENAIKIDGGFFLGELDVPDVREAQQFVGSEVEVISSTEVRGYTRIRGGWNVGKAYTVYYHAKFDQPCTSFVTYKDGELFTDQTSQYDSGDRTGVICKLEDHENAKVKLKIGLSFVSVGKAKANLDREIPHWSFDRVVQETRAKWESLISRIEPDASAPEDQKTMFYTALYHTMLMPVDRSGENPYFTATPYYDDYYAIWDTYRTSSPLLTLISPSKQAEIINSLLNIYRYDDYMPDARSGNSNGRTQGGSNTAVVIADAYEKGLEGIDYELALEAMIKDATIPPGNLEEQEGRGGLPDYNTLGYVSQRYPRGGTRTMEYAYNDFVLASVAEGLGKEETYQHYLSQSDNWQNLWRDVEDNGSRGFIMPRNADGSWVETIYCNLPDSPDESIDYHPLARDWPRCVCWWCGFFYEGSSWEYSLYVPHDVSRLIEMSGGDDAFLRRLNSLFERGFYNVGNEPSFLSPNLYHWLGRPDLSSTRIHAIVDANFNASKAGIPGNDDSGAMSSWLAFHMMGLFPNAGQSYYLISTPYFESTTFHLENGNKFRISTENLSDANQIIQSARLNGETLEQAWIEHSAIESGGELVLVMGDTSVSWGGNLLPHSKSTLLD